MAADVPAETDAPAETATPKRGFQFPSAVTTLAIVTVLVWVAAIFIPAGRYDTAADGSPKPGTFREVDSPLSAGERVEQLILAPTACRTPRPSSSAPRRSAACSARSA